MAKDEWKPEAKVEAKPEAKPGASLKVRRRVLCDELHAQRPQPTADEITLALSELR